MGGCTFHGMIASETACHHFKVVLIRFRKPQPDQGERGRESVDIWSDLDEQKVQEGALHVMRHGIGVLRTSEQTWQPD